MSNKWTRIIVVALAAMIAIAIIIRVLFWQAFMDLVN